MTTARAQEYLATLADRYQRIAERMKEPETVKLAWLVQWFLQVDAHIMQAGITPLVSFHLIVEISLLMFGYFSCI